MAVTINTGTMLIEAGALMPESLRFESEPWTPFYMAGEIIRELRKAPENKASTGAKTPERPEDHRRERTEMAMRTTIPPRYRTEVRRFL